jgi:1-deoxy-D-xylulose-5-phosphate synthase
MLVMAPSDENETRLMLNTGYQFRGPAAVRYPRGKATGCALTAGLETLPIGKGVIKRKGNRVAILSFGTLLAAASSAAEIVDATVADMRFVKPLDESLILDLAGSHDLIVTVEENTVRGGAGSSVAEFLIGAGITLPMLILGLPDKFLGHGKAADMLASCGLDAQGIVNAIRAKSPGE